MPDSIAFTTSGLIVAGLGIGLSPFALAAIGVMLTKESIDRRMERGKPLEQPTAAAQLEELRRRADVYVQILTKFLDNLEINTCTTDERMPAQR